jgi:hypothetical protein
VWLLVGLGLIATGLMCSSVSRDEQDRINREQFEQSRRRMMNDTTLNDTDHTEKIEEKTVDNLP